MLRRVLPFLALAAIAPAQEGAEEDRVPAIFFRSPDPKTERRITRELITNDGLGSGTREARTEARAALVEIGPWTVPYLGAAIHPGRRVKGVRYQKGVRIRMNALMVLARIGDPAALPDIRAALDKARSRDVRDTGALALGLFRDADDRWRLQEMLDGKDASRGAALALAKLRHPDADAILVAAAHNPSSDTHVAAAALLAAAVATPKTDSAKFLDHKEKLLRRTAATGLLIRPLPLARAEVLLRILRKPREDREIRALQYLALGAIRERDDEIREELLGCVRSHSEKKESRIAATLALAYEYGVKEHYSTLRGVYRTLRGRNDPLVSALLFAQLRTGDPEAVDDVLKVLNTGSPLLRFYAAGSLLFHVVNAPEAPRQSEILDRIEQSLRGGDPKHVALSQLAFRVRATRDLALRRELAAEGFAELGDPQGLHLWDWNRDDRAWVAVNNVIPAVFELDDLADRGQATVPTDAGSGSGAPNSGGEGGGGGGAPAPGGGPNPGLDRAATGTPEEQDFLDFLAEKPYFAPEDLGGR